MKNLWLPTYSELLYDRFEQTNLSLLQWHIAKYIFFVEKQFEDRKVSNIQNTIAKVHRCTVRSVQRSFEVLIQEGFLEKKGHSVSTTEKWLILNSNPSNDKIDSGKEDEEAIDGLYEMHYDENKGVDSIEMAFERFYEVYPRKEKKILAFKMFKSKKLYQQISNVVAATKNYASKMSDTDKQFIMLPATFLNNQIWEEYIGGAEEAKKIASGAVESDPFPSFIDKCSLLKSKWFNAAVYYKNVEEMNGADVMEDGERYFTDFEISVLNEVGFRAMMRDCVDGDFIVAKVKPVWDRMS